MSAGRGLWIDVCLSIVIGVAAGVLAFDYVSAHVAPNGSDDDTFRSVSAMVAPYKEDLLQPCLGQFGSMADPSALVGLPEWRAFLTRRLDAFPCTALSGVRVEPVAYSFWLQGHLHRTMSWMFRMTGPRLVGFAWYQALQYGLVLALLFGVFRLGMGRFTAGLAMIPLAVSPRHLEMALAPLEYAKAPFFAACLLGIGLLVRARLPRPVAYGVALATGLAVGVGLGFKPDVLVFAPFGVIALALFAAVGDAPRPAPRWLLVCAYVIGVAVAGGPTIRLHFFDEHRSLLPVQVLGGMAPVFVQQYAEPAIYNYGVMFDDDYVIAQINSYNQRVNGSAEFGLFFTQVLQRGALDLVTRLWRTFPGDVVLRVYAAVLQVFQFVPGGAVLAVIVLVGLCRVDIRLALWVGFVLAYMVGYVSLVFAPKHYFHLEFVPWWFAGCVAHYGVSAISRALRGSRGEAASSGPRHSWVMVAGMVALAIVTGGGALALARGHQDGEVRELLTGYLQPDRFDWTETVSDAASSAPRLLVPAGVALDANVMPVEGSITGRTFTSPHVQTDYLALRVQCLGAASADVVAVYRRPIAWRDALAVPCERAGQDWTVMWPVYQHLPYQVFDGFEVPDAGALRVQALGKAHSVEAFPLLLRLRLPEDWARRALHQTLDLSTVSPARVRPMRAALTAPPPPLPPPSAFWDPPFVRGHTPLPIEAPGLASWSAVTGVTIAPRSGGVLVTGDSSPFGYQLVSPPIPVPPHAKLVVRVFGEVEQGRAAFGILDGTGQHWLMPAVWGRSDFVTNTGANDAVVMVFANYHQPTDGTIASRFSVQSVSYDVQSSVLDRARTLLWPIQQ